MADEFLESDVVFPDHHNPEGCFEFEEVAAAHQQNSRAVPCGSKNSTRNEDRKKKKTKTVASSVPVNIPQRVLRSCDSDEEEVPPHVIVGRRMTGGKMAFSVCTGNGRTLKGRDLSQVRNSILRMTGFLEA